ncbi:hypothetical protein OA39_02257 [Vibrio campbellii]|uniref:hypothetical protein n=1 Tax=Vibrio TaxID=662 RepID=UPI000530BEFF|nr:MULTISPECIES: hypothetical protein [Vibrio]KGR35322.1 hypothetical protein OA39_02257 [Vibrio campbellii]CAD7810153.1 Chaperone [Vibrio sp. B1FIG11]CAE6911253.1 Chaperone [Vibrio sp. B1FIG11]
MMKKLFKKILLCAPFIPMTSQAIGIDSMMEFTVDGKAAFHITNGAEYRQFLQVGIAELSVVDGELKTTRYTRDNIDDWSLTVRPARTVIDPELQKAFQVSYTPQKNQLIDKDKVYQLSFIPTPYFAEGEKVTHTVQVAVGFAPIVIVPAREDKPIAYEMSYEGATMQLKNKGGTYLRAYLDACPSGLKGKQREECTSVVYGLSGRNLPIELKDKMKNAKEIKVELSTHNSKYKETFSLKPGKAHSSGE